MRIQQRLLLLRCWSLAFIQIHTSSAFLERLGDDGFVWKRLFYKQQQQQQHQLLKSTSTVSRSTTSTVLLSAHHPNAAESIEDKVCDVISLEDLREQIASAPHLVTRESFHTVLKKQPTATRDQVAELFQHMKLLPDCTPTRITYETIQEAWLRLESEKDSSVWLGHLQELWDLFEETQSQETMPHKSTYLLTFKGLLQCRFQTNVLDDAEALFDSMIRYSQDKPELAPDIKTANHVMMVWRKFGGHERCRSFLERLEKMALDGSHPQLRPNRYSYNLVLDTIAKRSQGNSAERAEELLSRMKRIGGCEPDIVAYNTVVDAWARSKAPDAAQRAEAIVNSMQKQFEEGQSDVQPDIVSYNTVMNALARSNKGFRGSRRFLDQMEKRNGAVKPNVISYNILISALANDPSVQNATEVALDIFARIRKVSDQSTRANCEPDCATYTSLIKVISYESNKDNPHYAEKAIELLEELEARYDETGDPALAPNVMSYTSTITSIGRSGTRPERAQAIVDRMEQRFLSGKSKNRPDHICYNALLNAYGWSDMPGRSLECYKVFQRMKDLYATKANLSAKPDIITCNAVLNSCAHEISSSAEERERILRAAIDVYEFFRSSAPQFGRLNHITFDRALKAVSKNLDREWHRHSLVESIFAQCCLSGNVSVLVVTTMFGILPYDRLSELLGNALVSEKGDPLHFNWKLLPPEYTKFAPRPHRKSFSKGSLNKPRETQRPSEYRVLVDRERSNPKGKQ